MRPDSQEESKIISLARSDFEAVKCEKCGAKMYPQSLLKPHLTRHRRRQRWFNTEIRKLQYTFTHMRDIA
jgi:uncharacterized OB-fold protein